MAQKEMGRCHHRLRNHAVFRNQGSNIFHKSYKSLMNFDYPGRTRYHPQKMITPTSGSLRDRDMSGISKEFVGDGAEGDEDISPLPKESCTLQRHGIELFPDHINH